MQVSSEHMNCITRIYDTVLDADAWTDMLEVLSGFAGARAAYLFGIDSLNPSRFAMEKMSRMFRPEDLETYNRDYAQYEGDPWGEVLKHPSGTFVTDEMVWPDRVAFTRRPDVVWALQRYNVFHRAGLKVSDTPAYLVGMAFNYERGRGPSSPAEQAEVAVLLPHLRQAIDINRTFFTLRSQLTGLARALDLLRFGVCILSDTGHVAIANNAARAMLDRNDGLRLLRDGTLVAGSSDATFAIRRAVRDVSLTARAEGTTAEAKFTVARGPGSLPYMLEFAPLRDMAGAVDRNLRGAVLLIIDPEDSQGISMDGLEQVLGLSPAERDVAELLITGLSNGEIAEQRSVSPETVKFQVAALLRKAACRRRIDLVRLAMTISLPLYSEGAAVPDAAGP